MWPFSKPGEEDRRDNPGRGEVENRPAGRPADLDAGRRRTWPRLSATPGWASLGMRRPSPPPEIHDLPLEWQGAGWTSQYGDDPREMAMEADLARMRRYERGRWGMSTKGPRSYVRTDERIRDEIDEVLTEHADIDATDVDFVVHEGAVTLTGHVPDRFTKYLVEDVVADLAGVRDIENQLKVRPRIEAYNTFKR